MPDLASIFGRHEFAIRRLHSLIGLIPVGAFLFVHLVTNVSILDGPATFQARVDQIHSIGPVTLLCVEWLFIFLPILFHGVDRSDDRRPGPTQRAQLSRTRENVRYTLQRWTGVIDVCVHPLARVSHPRLVRVGLVDGARHAAAGRRNVRSEHAAATAAASIQASRPGGVA